VDRFREDLRRHVEGLPVAAQKNTLWYRANKLVRRHTVVVAAGFLVAASLLAGISATTFRTKQKSADLFLPESERPSAGSVQPHPKIRSECVTWPASCSIAAFGPKSVTG
jgi:uncharacterized membrane protein YdfJ with MMPL/SSD domain